MVPNGYEDLHRDPEKAKQERIAFDADIEWSVVNETPILSDIAFQLEMLWAKMTGMLVYRTKSTRSQGEGLPKTRTITI